ncbi:MAG TPA: gamma-glutamyl-gamma-aminobutyrate hydrolase family protein [Planctomycetes bacterium]|nr:gamma-glutamyl-gamma-aminobutyrate hydrolase family protein [Planctomycetota bacterium]
MTPRIGMNCDIEEPGRTMLKVWIEYPDFLLRGGGLPLLFPPGIDVDDAIGAVDGLVLIGGDDYRAGLQPGRVGEPKRFLPVHPQREAFDLALAGAAIDRDIPVLGICGGFQALVLAAGGTLIGDIESEGPGNSITHRTIDEVTSTHPVKWLGGVEGMPGAGEFLVNTGHHQAVERLPEGWKPLATTIDGIVEAGVGPGRFQLGLQWHPERDGADSLGASAIRKLIEVCQAGST